MLHSVPVGGNNYGDQAVKGNFFVKTYTFFFIFVKIRETVRSDWPGVLPIFEQEGARPLNNLYITPTPPVL